MQIEEQQIVTISYELRDGSPQGELLEVMDVHYPFKFFFGGGQLLPAFEHHLRGLAEGQPFQFTLSPDEAYGPLQPDNIVDLPRDIFQADGMEQSELLVPGTYVSMQDNYGYSHNGKVLAVQAEAVTIDFNHAMAGKTLHFSGVVLNVRPATVEELIQKAYLEEDGLRSPHWPADDDDL